MAMIFAIPERGRKIPKTDGQYLAAGGEWVADSGYWRDMAIAGYVVIQREKTA